jgi:hypothetical protein
MGTQFRRTIDGTGNEWRDGCLSHPNSVDLRQWLRQRFMSAGLGESPTVDSQISDMLFQGEGMNIRVIILGESLWTDRQAFLNSIMRATALAGKSNRTYLALPKAAASLVDARLFHERGIGLFTYDHRNVDEALPARHFEMTTTALPQPEKGTADQLQNEIRELRTQVDTLERTVQSLSEELMSLRRTSPRQESVDPYVPVRVLSTVTAPDDLPTFFAGNPWVEVLSRRGREESTIAR